VPPPSPSKFSHVDLVVIDLGRSLDFYRGLLVPLGWTGVNEVRGERGETIHYLSQEGPGVAALGLRQRPDDAPRHAFNRYAVGLHHICFDAPSHDAVDKRAEWLDSNDAEIESRPATYDYNPGYYAVFFYDPDGIKLEIVHRPDYWRHAGAR
jgi:glyoxylase I family protein